jgi:hypothetical protein
MIISKNYGRKLVKSGEAEECTVMYDPHQDRSYMVLNDLKRQRTLHYFLRSGDAREEYAGCFSQEAWDLHMELSEDPDQIRRP